MSTWILRERWCLQDWPPGLINITIDVGLWSDHIASILFIPTTNECIIHGYRQICIHCGGLQQIGFLLSAKNSSDRYPMPSGRYFLCCKIHMTPGVQEEWITIPKV